MFWFPQLWSHLHRQHFHNNVDTNNFTESFNNVLKNHYLTLCHDKSVFSLTKILLQCVFPDQEREYTVLTARQTSAYRQPRDSLPHFLINRPNSVTSACLLNIEKGKTIELSSITEDAVNGVYSVKSKKGMYKVQIQEGDCSCPYFTQSRIPCKHIFSIIQNFRWRWEDLPHSLTESPFMTLDSDILHEQDEHLDLPLAEEDKSVPYTSIPLPPHQTAGSQLLRLQKQLRDELAKCSAAVFMVDDITLLENVQRKVHSIHSELLSTSSTRHLDELPILKNLMKEEVAEYRRKAKVMARANQLTHRYKKLKRKSNKECPIPPKRLRLKDDPLNVATRPSVGRPKGKKATKKGKLLGTGIELSPQPFRHSLFMHLHSILLQETQFLHVHLRTS